MKKIYIFLVLLSFISLSFVAAGVSLDSTTPIDDGVTIEIPVEEFDNDTAFVNLSMSSLGWLTTNQGRLTSTAQILHNLLDNLEWSNAGHTFDTAVDFGSNWIFGIANLTMSGNLDVGGDGNFVGNLATSNITYSTKINSSLNTIYIENNATEITVWF